MKYKTISIKVPDTLDELEIKKWVMVKVRRHFEAQKQEETKAIKDSIEADVVLVEKENGIEKIKEEII